MSRLSISCHAKCIVKQNALHLNVSIPHVQKCHPSQHHKPAPKARPMTPRHVFLPLLLLLSSVFSPFKVSFCQTLVPARVQPEAPLLPSYLHSLFPLPAKCLEIRKMLFRRRRPEPVSRSRKDPVPLPFPRLSSYRFLIRGIGVLVLQGCSDIIGKQVVNVGLRRYTTPPRERETEEEEL